MQRNILNQRFDIIIFDNNLNLRQMIKNKKYFYMKTTRIFLNKNYNNLKINYKNKN